MSRPARALAAVLVLALAAAAAVAFGGTSGGPESARGRDFQRAVGGLGLSDGLSLSSCPHGFDPRLDDSCSARHEPLAGGGSPCARHAGLLPPP